ncbi:MAG TPA: hypothetical protein ACFYD6_11425 [Candidatus Brocadiia bacterium]|nr:hypothetical protein [Candidatus Brocadiales bacterium]
MCQESQLFPSFGKVPMYYAEYRIDKKMPEIMGSPTIKDLYPYLDEGQLKEAEENFKRYLDVVLCIYARIENETNRIQRLSLTTLKRNTTIDFKGSNLI